MNRLKSLSMKKMANFHSYETLTTCKQGHKMLKYPSI